MAELLKVDSIEGSRIVREGLWTRELIRAVIVKGLTAGSYGLKSACDAVGAAWQEHPTMPGLRLVGVDAEGLGPDHARVLMRYVDTAPRIYSGGVRLELRESDKDLNGNKITVACGGSADYGYIPREKRTQVGSFTYPAAVPRIEILRIEPSLLMPGGIDPIAVSTAYGGSVNNGTWLYRMAGAWLCEGVLFNNDGLGDVAWNMQYAFALNDNGWQPEVIFIDPETKEPRADAADQTGRKTVDKLREMNFGALNLV